MWCFTSSLMLQQCKQQEDYRKSMWWLFSLFGLFLSRLGFHCVPKHVDQQEQVAWLVRWHRIVLFCPLSWNQPAHKNECTVVCCFEMLFVLEHDTSIWKETSNQNCLKATQSCGTGTFLKVLGLSPNHAASKHKSIRKWTGLHRQLNCCTFCEEQVPGVAHPYMAS